MTAFPVADSVSIDGVVNVTGSVGLTTAITANTATTGSAGLAVGNAPYAPLYVTGSVALNPTPVITANTATTGSAGLAVGNAPYQPLYVTGSVALNPTPVITANTATTGSTGLAVGNAPYQPLFISVTSSLPVTFGGLPPLSVFNATNVGVTGSVQAWSQGIVGVSGTVGVNNFPLVQAVSGVVSLGNWPTTIGVSSSFPLQTWIAATVGVSGTVGVNNFPAVLAVSGSQLTGSTFGGFPFVVAGIFSASNAATIRALQLDTAGALYVTTSGSVPVATTGSAGLQVSFGGLAQPVSMSNSGPIGVFLTGAIAVSTTGSSGLQVSFGGVAQPVSMSNSGPIGIFLTGSIPITTSGSAGLFVSFGGQSQPVTATGTVRTWDGGVQAVSGTVGVNNFPLVQAVSGSQLTGSTFAGSPVVIGGVFYTSGILGSGSYVKSIETDISGAVYVTTSGSIPVSTTGSAGLQVSFGGLVQPVSMSNSGPIGVFLTGSIPVATTGSAGLQVSFGSIAQPVSMSNSGPIGVFLTGSIPVTITGSAGLQISFGGLSQPVSMSNNGPTWITGSVALNPTPTITANTVTTGSAGLAVGNAPYAPLYVTGSVALNPTPVITANTATTGSTGLAVGNAPYQPLFISITSSLPVTFGGLPPLSVWNAGTVGVSGTVGVNNFPLVQAVSGSQLTGSTFGGSPVVVGGVFYTSGILGSGSYIKTIETDISGAVYVTTSGSIPVSTTGSAGLQISFGGISQPITATGSIAVSTTGSAGLQVSHGGITQPVNITNTQLSVTTTGTALFVGNSPTSPLFISVTSSLPVTFGGLPPLSVWNAGTVGVSGTVGVNNFPLVQAVSGSQLTGSTFAGSPVVIGGVFYTSGILGSGSYVKSIETDISGAVYITTSGSIPVSTTGSAGLQVSFGSIAQPVSMSNSGPIGVFLTGSIPITITGSAGLQISHGGISQPVSMSNSGPIGVFLTGSIPVTITGSAGLQISFGGLSQPVSMSNNGPTWITGSVGLNPTPVITANTATTGNFGLAVGNAPYTPIFISVTSSLPVTFAGLPPLSVWNAGLVGVSGTVTANVTTTGSALLVGNPSYAPLFISVTSSLPVTFGGLPPLSVWNAGTVGVSGTVGVNNFPLVQAVSGSQLTGSTFAGSPVVIGGVFYTSGILGSGSYVKTIETDISGAVYITTSGSIPVSTTGSAGLQVSFGSLPQPVSMSNSGPIGVFLTGSIPVTITGSAGLQVSFGGISQPVSMSNSGPIGVFLTGSIPVTITGSAGLQVSYGGISQPVNVTTQISVNNFPAFQAVSGGIVVQNWPVTIGVSSSSPLSVWNAGTVGVSGTLRVWDGGTQGVSGSQLTGSTFSGFPFIVGGVFTASGSVVPIVKALLVDVSGSAYVRPTLSEGGTTSTVASSATVVTLLTAKNRFGATIYNDATGAALYVNLGLAASLTVFTVKIWPSGYYEVPFGYSGVITGIWSTAEGNARITEIT